VVNWICLRHNVKLIVHGLSVGLMNTIIHTSHPPNSIYIFGLCVWGGVNHIAQFQNSRAQVAWKYNIYQLTQSELQMQHLFHPILGGVHLASGARGHFKLALAA